MLVEALTGNSQLSLLSPLQLSITISTLLWGCFGGKCWRSAAQRSGWNSGLAQEAG